MKKLFTSALLFLAALSVNAQDINTLLQEMPSRAACNMHSYEFCEINDTPAPKGFKPFYISHYGRHGSRYEQNSTFADYALEAFARMDSLGILTTEGKSLMAEVTAVRDAHVGVEGALTPRGAREHRQLAARMAQRFPEVFQNRNRQEINCIASTSQRCIVSMTNFSYSLKEQYPSLDFTFDSADKYMKFICPSLNVYAPGNEPATPPAKPDFSKFMFPKAKPAFAPNPGVPGYDFNRFLNVLVTDLDRALAELGNPERFVREIFSTGGYCQVADFLGIDILGTYFTTDELVYLWAPGNDNIYRMWAASVEVGDNIRWAERPLLQNFIDTADKALEEGSSRAADLRFGHDTAVLPLFALMGIDDLQGRRFPFKEAHLNGWYSFFQIPMATNCQMIYYRNKKGEVLTKILYNEKEVTLPGLPTEQAPYYRWDDLRAYFLKLIAWED